MYKKNYLSQVIARVDFGSPITTSPENLEKIKERFKLLNVETKENLLKTFEVDVQKETTKFAVIGKQAIYVLPDGKKQFELTNECFLLSVHEYSDSKSFFELFKTGFNIIKEVLAVDEFKKIGLRYINTIGKLVQSEIEWQKYINNPFAIPYKDLMPNPDSFSVRRSMLKSIISDGEFGLNLSTGIWNQAFPRKIVEHEFIVDIDCYVSDLILSSQDIVARLPKMNDLCREYFEKIITNEFRKTLEE